MKKGIAIESILLLLIGILVAGILIYLVYRYSNRQIISETDCTGRLSEMCSTCKNSGWGSWPNRGVASDAPFFKIIDDCASYSKFSVFSGVNDCAGMKNGCKMLGIE